MGTSLLRTNHLIMKLIIACLLFVAVRGEFTNNSTQDRYVKPEDLFYDPRTYVQPEVDLILYSPENSEGIKIYPTSGSQDLDQLIWDLPMKVFVHGFFSTGESRGREMAAAFLTPRDTTNFLNLPGDDGNVNVILVKWRSKAVPYINMAFRAMHVGEFLANWLFQTVYPRNPNLDLHLIGHSLGAQAVGKTGRRLGQVDRPPRRVTGLDPAGPRFEWYKTTGLERIMKDSGLFVDIIHTNPGILGVKKQYGHLDFYVDGGFQNLRQFRGFRDGKSKYRNKLSHSHATTMFIESILEPTKYVSLPCARVDPTVKTSRNQICIPRTDDVYAYRNFLGNGAIPPEDGDIAYGTYIADLEDPAVEELIRYLEGLEDDGMEADAAMQ